MIRSPTHIFHETKTPTGLDQKFRRAKMFEHLWYRGLNQPCFFCLITFIKRLYTIFQGHFNFYISHGKNYRWSLLLTKLVSSNSRQFSLELSYFSWHSTVMDIHFYNNMWWGLVPKQKISLFQLRQHLYMFKQMSCSP